MGCDRNPAGTDCRYAISTHTSRVGCDWCPWFYRNTIPISTHTSRVGCDSIPNTFTIGPDGFLLTHPVWDVTAIYSILQSQHPHISRDGLIIHLELY